MTDPIPSKWLLVCVAACAAAAVGSEALAFTTTQGATTPVQCPPGYRELYVNPASGNDAQDGRTPSTPLLTVKQARALARGDTSYPGYCVLLRENNTFSLVNDTRRISNPYVGAQDPDRRDFAFLWDVAAKPLVFTSYNMGTPGAKPVVTSGKRRKQGGATVGFGVMRYDDASAKPGTVLLYGIRFTDFQLGGVQLQDTDQPVIIQACEFDRIGTRYLNASASATEPNNTSYPFDPLSGSYDTMIQSDYDGNQGPSQERLYAAGVFYVRKAFHVTIASNVITNAHNDVKKLDKMHVFYLSTATDVDIFSNTIGSTSGSPLKVRHHDLARGDNDVDVWNNTFTRAGPSQRMITEVVQPNAAPGERSQSGFFQYAGDAGECPTGVRIRNNHFQRPYCYGDVESCAAAAMSPTFDAAHPHVGTGAACDNSNTGACPYALSCSVAFTPTPGPASGDASTGTAWDGNDWDLGP